MQKAPWLLRGPGDDIWANDTFAANLWIPPSIEAAMRMRRLGQTTPAPHWPGTSGSPRADGRPPSPRQMPPPLRRVPADVPDSPPYSPRNPNRSNYRNFSSIPGARGGERSGSATQRGCDSTAASLLPRPRSGLRRRRRPRKARSCSSGDSSPANTNRALTLLPSPSGALDAPQDMHVRRPHEPRPPAGHWAHRGCPFWNPGSGPAARVQRRWRSNSSPEQTGSEPPEPAPTGEPEKPEEPVAAAATPAAAAPPLLSSVPSAQPSVAIARPMQSRGASMAVELEVLRSVLRPPKERRPSTPPEPPPQVDTPPPSRPPSMTAETRREQLRRRLDVLDAELGWPIPERCPTTDQLLNQRGTQRAQHAVVIGCGEYADEAVPPNQLADLIAGQTAELLRARGFSVDELRQCSPSPLLRPTTENVLRVLRHVRAGYPETHSNETVNGPRREAQDATPAPTILVVFAGRRAACDQWHGRGTRTSFRSTASSVGGQQNAAGQGLQGVLLLHDTLLGRVGQPSLGGLQLSLLESLTDAESRPIQVFVDVWPVSVPVPVAGCSSARGAPQPVFGGASAAGACSCSWSTQRVSGQYGRPSSAGVMLMMLHGFLRGESLRGRVRVDGKQHPMRFGSVAMFIAAKLEELGVTVKVAGLGRDAPPESAVIIAPAHVPAPADAVTERRAAAAVKTARVTCVGWVKAEVLKEHGVADLMSMVLGSLDSAERQRRKSRRASAGGPVARLRAASTLTGLVRPASGGRSASRGKRPVAADVSPWDSQPSPPPPAPPGLLLPAAEPAARRRSQVSFTGSDTGTTAQKAAPPTLANPVRRTKSVGVSRRRGSSSSPEPKTIPTPPISRRASALSLQCEGGANPRRRLSTQSFSAGGQRRLSTLSFSRTAPPILPGRRRSSASPQSKGPPQVHHSNMVVLPTVMLVFHGSWPALAADLAGPSASWTTFIRGFLNSDSADCRVVSGGSYCTADAPTADAERISTALEDWRASESGLALEQSWRGLEEDTSEDDTNPFGGAKLLRGHRVESVWQRCEVCFSGSLLALRKLQLHTAIGSFLDLLHVESFTYDDTPHAFHAAATKLQAVWKGWVMRRSVRQFRDLIEEEAERRQLIEHARAGGLPGAREQLSQVLRGAVQAEEEVYRQDFVLWEMEERILMLFRYVQACRDVGGAPTRAMIESEERFARLDVARQADRDLVLAGWRVPRGLPWPVLVSAAKLQRDVVLGVSALCDREFLHRLRAHNDASMLVALGPAPTKIVVLSGVLSTPEVQPLEPERVSSVEL